MHHAMLCHVSRNAMVFDSLSFAFQPQCGLDAKKCYIIKSGNCVEPTPRLGICQPQNRGILIPLGSHGEGLAGPIFGGNNRISDALRCAMQKTPDVDMLLPVKRNQMRLQCVISSSTSRPGMASGQECLHTCIACATLGGAP